MMLKKIKMVGLFFCSLLFQTFGFSDNQSEIEPWISTNDLYEIKVEMTTNEVINKLGDPLIIETILDDDIIITNFVYSFRTKVYDKNILEESDANISELPQKWGRITNIQFVFTDDKLTSWEEDKLTLSMAEKEPPSNGSSFQIFNFLLNVIVITLNAAVLMSL